MRGLTLTAVGWAAALSGRGGGLVGELRVFPSIAPSNLKRAMAGRALACRLAWWAIRVLASRRRRRRRR